MMRIYLTGTPRFSLDDSPLPQLNAYFVEALLGMLLLHERHSVSRAELMTQLWPGSSDPSRQNSLRQLLHRIKVLWPEYHHFLQIQRDMLSWNPTGPWSLDVNQLLQLSQGPYTREALDGFLSLYQGPLLEQHGERWILAYRVRLMRQLSGFLVGMRAAAQQEGELQWLARIHGALVLLQPDQGKAWAQYSSAVLKAYTPALAHEALELHQRLHTRISEADSRAFLLALEPAASPVERPALSPASRVSPGRADLETSLRTLWQEVLGGKPRACLLTASPGVGCEGLLDWLREQVQLQAGGVVRVRGSASAASFPLHVVGAIRRGLHLPVCPTETSPLEALENLRTALNALTPALLVVEQVQWCDEASLELLSTLFHDQALGGVMVVFTDNRLLETPGQMRRAALLDAILESVGGRRFPLGPLDRTELAAHAEGLLGRALRPQELSDLMRHSSGIPGLVHRGLVALGLLSAGAPDGYSLGPHLRTLLASCSSDARLLLESCAVYNRPLPLLLARQLLGDELRLIQALQELIRLELLREDQEGALSFTLEAYREAVVQDLPGFQRTLLGLWIQRCTAGQPHPLTLVS